MSFSFVFQVSSAVGQQITIIRPNNPPTIQIVQSTGIASTTTSTATNTSNILKQDQTSLAIVSSAQQSTICIKNTPQRVRQHKFIQKP